MTTITIITSAATVTLITVAVAVALIFAIIIITTTTTILSIAFLIAFFSGNGKIGPVHTKCICPIMVLASILILVKE